jgi:hypothetical protein
MIRKLFNKSIRAINKRQSLAKEARALSPLVALLEAGDLDGAVSLCGSDDLQKAVGKVGMSHESLTILVSSLASSKGGRRVLARPHNFSGHLTHYHHFFGAVILPLLEWISVGILSEGDLVVVPDCGPMNHEFQQWAAILGLKSATAPLSMVATLERSSMLDVWDAPGYDFSFREDWYPRKLVVDRVREHVFGRLGEATSSGVASDPAQSRIVVIARAKPDPFYKSKRADTKSSGAQRRSIPNLEALVDALSQLTTNVRIAYLEQMTVVEKIALFRDVDLVIGQMGAGLNNALWMRPGSAMIEILSLDSIRPNFAVFANICHRMDVRHRRVVQESNHAPVNLALIKGFAKDLLATDPSC